MNNETIRQMSESRSKSASGPAEHSNCPKPRLPVLVKIGLIVFGGITILFLFFLTVCFLLFNGLCENAVKSEVVSPDGNLKAVVFCRDCGATTDFSTQVSVLNAGDSLPNWAGNVYTIDNAHDSSVSQDVIVHWKDNRTLVIEHDPYVRDCDKKYAVTIPRFPFWRQVKIQYADKIMDDREAAPGSADYALYMKTLEHRVKELWCPPNKRASTSACISFKIKRDGTIFDIGINKSSSDPEFDSAAIATIQSIKKLDPLPPGREKDVEIQFTFDFNVFPSKDSIWK